MTKPEIDYGPIKEPSVTLSSSSPLCDDKSLGACLNEAILYGEARDQIIDLLKKKGYWYYRFVDDVYIEYCNKDRIVRLYDHSRRKVVYDRFDNDPIDMLNIRIRFDGFIYDSATLNKILNILDL